MATGEGEAFFDYQRVYGASSLEDVFGDIGRESGAHGGDEERVEVFFRLVDFIDNNGGNESDYNGYGS